jgi:hypothetical protein
VAEFKITESPLWLAATPLAADTEIRERTATSHFVPFPVSPKCGNPRERNKVTLKYRPAAIWRWNQRWRVWLRQQTACFPPLPPNSTRSKGPVLAPFLLSPNEPALIADRAINAAGIKTAECGLGFPCRYLADHLARIRVYFPDGRGRAKRAISAPIEIPPFLVAFGNRMGNATMTPLYPFKKHAPNPIMGSLNA